MSKGFITRRTKVSQEYDLLADIEVTESAVTSVDITGLNIGKDEEIVISGIFINSSTTADLRLTINGNNTATNYWRQQIFANGTSVSGLRENNPIISFSYTSETTYFELNLKLTNNGYIITQSNNSLGITGIKILDNYETSTFTTTSIISLLIASNLANAIGIGSRFQLYRIGA